MKTPQYPLEQLKEIKTKRFEEAVRVLEKTTEILFKEQEILFEKKKERDSVVQHKNEKLNQLRDILDKGTTPLKIEQMKLYLTVVDEKIENKQREVDKQQEAVDKAQKEYEKAKVDLFEKRKAVEKLKIHKEEWKKEAKYEISREEAKEHDELGSNIHSLRSKAAKERKKQVEKKKNR